MNEHVHLLKTLADPTRLTLFKLLLAEELCVCELRELLGVSQPAVSQHLARLKAAGLVSERKSGSWTYYRGDLARATAALGEVITFLATDPAAIPELAPLAARRAAMDRASMCGVKMKKGAESA